MKETCFITFTEWVIFLRLRYLPSKRVCVGLAHPVVDLALPPALDVALLAENDDLAATLQRQLVRLRRVEVVLRDGHDPSERPLKAHVQPETTFKTRSCTQKTTNSRGGITPEILNTGSWKIGSGK